jgi:hypothetical protein
MKIVEGTWCRPGRPGFLFAKHVYEEQLKLKAAAPPRSDQGRHRARGETIAKEPELQRMVRENDLPGARDPSPARRDEDRRLPRQSCSASWAARRPTSAKLLAAFFQTDDQNLRARYEFFYRSSAPSLELYRVRVGDVLTIKAFTRSGYVQSVNVPVYGTFQFQGLEKSTLAGALNLMDLVSFRELYGFMSGEKPARDPSSSRRRRASARRQTRKTAEAELFGSNARRRAGDEPRRIEATATPRGVGPAMRDLGESVGGKLQARRGAQAASSRPARSSKASF